ncbi:MAG: dihydroorotate dehydrogenase [Candidatus Omnitrophota bacterium]|nr:MAG: dihydroorotate dehydrogenase [Candidatus Omnitrophota bacterium]
MARNREPLNLGVNIGKLQLASPIVCASGTFGFGEELTGLVDFSSIGAVTTKTVTLQPKAGNAPPRIFDSGCGVINSVGLENPGLESFLNDTLPKIKKLNTKFIVSIGADTAEEYAEIVKKLDDVKDVEALEANLSCPNIKNKKIVSQDKEATYQLIQSLTSLTAKPLIVKITPETVDIVGVARAAASGGADAVSLVNTFFAMAIDIETARPYLGNIYGGYSGPAIKPMSLYRVWRAAAGLEIPVIGGGGIVNAADAIEFILAGATAVSLGTVNLVYPNKAKDILGGIKDYMVKKKIKDVRELKEKVPSEGSVG